MCVQCIHTGKASHAGAQGSHICQPLRCIYLFNVYVFLSMQKSEDNLEQSGLFSECLDHLNSLAGS